MSVLTLQGFAGFPVWGKLLTSMFTLSEDKNSYGWRGAGKNPAPKVQFYRDPHAWPAHPQAGQPACSDRGGGSVAVQWKEFLQMTFQTILKTRLKI